MRMIIALVAALQTAAPSSPVSLYDTQTDFSHYRTYKWVFSSAPGGMDQNLYRQIRAAIDRSLADRGFGKSDQGDFAIAFTVGPRDKVHPTDYGLYALYYSGEEAAANKKWINDKLGNGNHAHTLSIDIYDAYNKHAVWSGVGPVPILPKSDSELIEKEVKEVLGQFPPKTGCPPGSDCKR
jgi:hypothetical protein